MRFATAAASVLLLCSCAGCLSVCNNAYRTLVKEPKQFSWRRDRCESRTLYASWAADAWTEQQANGAPCRTADYALGFQDGFVEYCYAGGSGEPPPVPPRPYWNAVNRVAPLDKRAYDWFDGYRLGARIAKQGGYRSQAVVPASASLCSHEPCGCDGERCDVGGCEGGGCPVVPEQADQPESLPHPADALPAFAPDSMTPADPLEQPMLLGPEMSPVASPKDSATPSARPTAGSEASRPTKRVVQSYYNQPAPAQSREQRAVKPVRFGNDFLR